MNFEEDICYPLNTPNLWEGFKVHEIPISEILPQADPGCLEKLKKMDLKDPWIKHLQSLQKYKNEVLSKGWMNPICISLVNEGDLSQVPSKEAYHSGIKYIIGIGYNRHFWSTQWKTPTIKAIIKKTWLEAQELRSLMEVYKKIKRFGIKRAKGNIILSDDKMRRYSLYSTRVPQRLLPRFEIAPSRIVERFKNERLELTGKHRVVRPMFGAKSHTSKFFQISGKPPKAEEPFITCLLPEGWISMANDFYKYLRLFQEWR